MIYDYKNKSLLIHIFDNYSYQDIADFINLNSPDTLIINGAYEWSWACNFQDQRLKLINEAIINNNTDAYFLLCPAGKESYHFELDRFLPDFKFLFFPLIYLPKVVKKLGGKAIFRQPKQLFYSQINNPHDFRAILVDNYAKHGLESVGKFTWNKLRKDYNGVKDYEFKYWEEELIYADDNFSQENFNSYTPPEDLYFDSLWDIVPESCDNCIHLSEKTWKPIVYRKPFIIYGAKGYNAALERYGFKLFRNLIDYSFDEVDDMELKAELLCKELLKLKEIPLETQLDEVDSTISFNRSKALELQSDERGYHSPFIFKHIKSFIFNHF